MVWPRHLTSAAPAPPVARRTSGLGIAGAPLGTAFSVLLLPARACGRDFSGRPIGRAAGRGAPLAAVGLCSPTAAAGGCHLLHRGHDQEALPSGRQAGTPGDRQGQHGRTLSDREPDGHGEIASRHFLSQDE